MSMAQVILYREDTVLFQQPINIKMHARHCSWDDDDDGDDGDSQRVP